MSAKGDKDREESLRQLLLQQYSHAEQYCNAQTRLQNALVGKKEQQQQLVYQHTLQLAVQDLQESIDLVRQDLETLKSLELEDRNLCKALQAHLEKSRRVVKTLYHSGGRLHANGIPATKDDYDTKIVALATLNASIAKLESFL